MEIDEKFIETITKLVVKKIKEVQIEESLPNYLIDIGEAYSGNDVKDVVIGIAPSFGKYITKTINGLDHKNVIKEIIAGIEEEGMNYRIVRVLKTSDVSFIGKEAAVLSGSGIGIGIQSKGTAIIHQKDLYPLTNLELFSQAPLLNLDSYRAIGKNAARYAKGMTTKPIEVVNDCMVRPKYQVKAAVMHIKETEKVEKTSPSIEIKLGGR